MLLVIRSEVKYLHALMSHLYIKSTLMLITIL